MNVLVAGATGKTGRLLTRELIEQGAHPVALVRESSDTSVLPDDTDTLLGDLANLQDDVCAGMDVVIFAAGSGGDTDAEMTDKIDRDGARTLMDLAEKAGVARFVMLSSVGADAPPPDHELAHYLQAKHDADEHLKQRDMPYAIIRPVALTDGPKTGQVRLGDSVDKSAKAHRADVAAVLAKAAVTGRYDGKALDMQTA
ncbi:SDR family oxidoreductase [Sulfitobacter sp. HNIBRBA3233]|uniref:SDR family oxidoreductase n=1 Tax=Sulfitobacter marinivivus TaxID=3158558 RepID=UPI0032DFF0F2